MIISFIYIRVAYVSDGIWVLMTCAIVLFDNSTVGGAMIKGYYRMIGTLVAALFSTLVIIFFANSTIANLIAIALSIFFAAYYFMDTKKAYIGGLIAWTTPIMLVNNHTLTSIFMRPINILVGIAISYFLQRLFYPEHAKNVVLKSFSELVAKAELLLNTLIDDNKYSEELQIALEKMEAAVISNINKADKLITEANTELPKVQDYGKICADLVVHLRRMFRFTAVFTYQLQNKLIDITPEFKGTISEIIAVLASMHNNFDSNIKNYNISSDFYTAKDLLYTIEHNRFLLCDQEQILMLQIIIKELNIIYGLMLEIFAIRKKYNMY